MSDSQKDNKHKYPASSKSSGMKKQIAPHPLPPHLKKEHTLHALPPRNVTNPHRDGQKKY